jgi:hypothetical protein
MSQTVELPVPEVEVLVFVPPVDVQVGVVLFTWMVTAPAVSGRQANESKAAAPLRLARNVLVISLSLFVKYSGWIVPVQNISWMQDLLPAALSIKADVNTQPSCQFGCCQSSREPKFSRYFQYMLQLFISIK